MQKNSWMAVCAALAFHALPFSFVRAETIVQAVETDYLAFEAERAGELSTSGAIEWDVVADPVASGGVALNSRGVSSLGMPGGIAEYLLRFALPGRYVLYSRWKSDPEVAATEPFGANSFSYPRAFGTSPIWARSRANERSVPESLEYDWTEDNIDYEVTSDDVAAGRVFTFLLGTREHGLILDRVVLKIGRDHSAAQLASSIESPGESTAPQALTVLAGHDLRTVTVTFDQPISRVAATNFSAAGLSCDLVGIDLGNPRQVVVSTSAQTEGAEYALEIRGVAGASGAPMIPDTNVFRAAQLIPGWASAGLYSAPDDVEPAIVLWLDRFEFQASENPAGGAGLSGLFIPEAAGRYSLFSKASGDLQISFWNSATNGFTNTVTAGPSAEFGPDAAMLTPLLTAGERYFISARVAPSNGPVWLAVAARLNSAEELEPISNARLASLINSDRAELRVTQQPASQSIVGGQPVTLSVQADSKALPIFYQWQRNGADIPGATQPAYTTPMLTAGDTGDRYRAVIRAGGAVTASEEAVMTVNPGALTIVRTGNGGVVSWGVAAVGATLEWTVQPGAGAEWTEVENLNPIAEAGSVQASGGPARIFRVRK